jgi:hypothetical protein
MSAFCRCGHPSYCHDSSTAQGTTPGCSYKCGCMQLEMETEFSTLETKNAALVATLKTIQQWDALNPPAKELLSDLVWLKKLVDDALKENK